MAGDSFLAYFSDMAEKNKPDLQISLLWKHEKGLRYLPDGNIDGRT